VTMLAWEDPYDEDNDPHSSLDNYSILVSFFFLYSQHCFFVNKAPKYSFESTLIHSYYEESLDCSSRKGGF
jgi:hypothetical protein